MSDIGQARTDLHQILNLTAHLLDQAFYGGNNGHLEAGRPIPGGEATVLLAPVADYRTWCRRVVIRLDHTTRARAAGLPHDPWITDDQDSDGDHPALVLAFWDDAWRELNRHTPPVRPTLAAHAGYLNSNMAAMSAEPRARFGEFASDMHNTRARLETILGAGDRDEHGAPCLHCHTTLTRRHHPVHGRQDWWDCPRCQRAYSHAEYWNAVAAQYRANAPALTADDLAVQYGIPKGSIRGWASLGKIRKRGRDLIGRTLYDVGDTLTQANGTAA